MERIGIAPILFIYFIALATASLVHAQDYSPSEKEAITKSQNREALSAWPSISFICTIDEDPGADASASRKICDSASTDARLIAAQSRVSLRVAPSISAAYVSSAAGSALVFEMQVRQTSEDDFPSAIAIAARAWAFASDVRFQERDPADRLTVIKEHDRSGQLELWSHPVVVGASDGPPDPLVPQMSDAAEEILKRFFTTYLEAQEPAATE